MVQIPLGISYISAVLKKEGHRTHVVVVSSASSGHSLRLIDESISRHAAGLVCFTSIATEYGLTSGLAREVKKRHPRLPLLIGGPHATLNPEEVMADGFDAVCVGEGEHPTLELVSQLEKGVNPAHIPNLWIRHGQEVERNASRPFLDDLDSLPFPDREMWQEWIEEREPAKHVVLLGRGCPFHCTYCCNHAIRRTALGIYVRKRAPARIADEIRDGLTRYPSIREVYFEMETIGQDKKWVMALCSELDALNRTLKRPLPFGTNFRITPHTEVDELFEALAGCNFGYLNIGLESGSEKIRREVLKREYSNEDVRRVVAAARKQGLRVNFYNLIGIPSETMADVMETVKVNRACMPDSISTSIFFPYPGTELHARCREMGLLGAARVSQTERRIATLDLPGFPRKEIQKCYIWFDYWVYWGRVPAWKLLARVFRLKVGSYLLLQRLYGRFRAFMLERASRRDERTARHSA